MLLRERLGDESRSEEVERGKHEGCERMRGEEREEDVWRGRGKEKGRPRGRGRKRGEDREEKRRDVVREGIICDGDPEA